MASCSQTIQVTEVTSRLLEPHLNVRHGRVRSLLRKSTTPPIGALILSGCYCNALTHCQMLGHLSQVLWTQ